MAGRDDDTPHPSDPDHRFPAEIVGHAVRLPVRPFEPNQERRHAPE